MRTIAITIGSILLIAVLALGYLWLSGRQFGMQQAVEFFPYHDEIELDDGSAIESGGVIVRVNEYNAASSDCQMATLMLSAMELYPAECSGDNWEVAVRRPTTDGGEERYSYSVSVYEAYMTGESGPVSWIEYGLLDGGNYTIIKSYPADWNEIESIAHGQSIFKIEME